MGEGGFDSAGWQRMKGVSWRDGFNTVYSKVKCHFSELNKCQKVTRKGHKSAHEEATRFTKQWAKRRSRRGTGNKRLLCCLLTVTVKLLFKRYVAIIFKNSCHLLLMEFPSALITAQSARGKIINRRNTDHLLISSLSLKRFQSKWKWKRILHFPATCSCVNIRLAVDPESGCVCMFLSPINEAGGGSSHFARFVSHPRLMYGLLQPASSCRNKHQSWPALTHVSLNTADLSAPNRHFVSPQWAAAFMSEGKKWSCQELKGRTAEENMNLWHWDAAFLQVWLHTSMISLLVCIVWDTEIMNALSRQIN